MGESTGLALEAESGMTNTNVLVSMASRAYSKGTTCQGDGFLLYKGRKVHFSPFTWSHSHNLPYSCPLGRKLFHLDFFDKMLSMFLFSFIHFLPTIARPQHFPPWQAPGSGDCKSRSFPREPALTLSTSHTSSAARSACPGINALANHGLLPRSGRGIDLPTLRRAVTTGFNIDSDPTPNGMLLADAFFNLAVTTNVDPSNNKTFDLDLVSKHNCPVGPIEFDGSLSRDDFFSGDQTSFNQGIFAETKGIIEEGLVRGEGVNGTVIDLALAAKARTIRVYNQSKRNPDFFVNDTVVTLSCGTTALYLSVLGDPVEGSARFDWMKILFGKIPSIL